MNPVVTEARPNRSLAIPENEIHVWQATLDGPGWPPRDHLPGEERERALRLRRPGAARRWVAARWALRGVLAHYLEESPAEIALRLASHGKPMLTGPAAALRFNLSHSGDLALVAVAREREVGVDVEWIDSRRDVLALAPHALDDATAATVRAAAPDARPAAFHAAWVRREAVAKCLGSGLGVRRPKANMAISELDAGPAFAAALAVAGDELPPLRHFAITEQMECLRSADTAWEARSYSGHS